MVGTISTHESGVDLIVEWKLENFFNLPESDGESYFSPDYSFGSERWCLEMYPNGWNLHGSSGHVDLVLCKFRSDRSIKQSFYLSLKTATEEKCNEQHFTKDFDNDNFFHIFYRFIARSELSRRRSDLVPDGTLTIIFTMKNSTSGGSDSNTASTSDKCCHCKITFNAQNLSSHQRKCMHRPIKCPDCLEIVVLQKWLDQHDCPKERSEGKYREENSKSTCVEACTQTEKGNDCNCREKLLMALCIVSILIAIVTGCALAYSKTPLSSSHPCGEAVTKIQISEINKAVNRSEVLESNEFDASGSNETGATDIKQSEGLNKTAELNAELKKADQSEIVGSDIPEASAANQANSAKSDESESVNKTLAAEMNKTDQSEIAGSDIPEASAANEADTAETDESEPLPQPVLMVTEVGSTYLEVVWVLPEESKSNAAHMHYIVHYRKYGAQWQEVSLPEASRTSYSLTNLDPGMSYQICVMAVDSSGFSRRSETATFRTSNKVIFHNTPKGHEKQFVLYAAAVIILIIVTACVYEYSKTSLSATHPYGEGTQTLSAEEDNIIKADLSEIAEANESEASDSKTCPTENEGPEGTQTISAEEDNIIKADLSEVAETDESEDSYSKTCATKTEGPITFDNPPEDCGFVTDINHLLKENRGIDVTFEIETPNGKTKLFAHKLILAVMSSYFADKFYDKGRNKGHQVIPLKGIDPKDFEQIIRYCYGEKLSLRTIEDACALFKIASEFNVISLQNLCHTFFRHTKIEPGNVFSILKISVEIEDQSLQDMCFKILQEKTREVVAAYELCDITPAMVYTLLNLPKLSLNSEYELIKWIFDWAKVKSEDKNSSCRSTRDFLAKLLRNMNFFALTVKDFVMLTRDNPKFFNSDEIASISMNIVIPGTREMPVWHNKDLKGRVYTGSNE